MSGNLTDVCDSDMGPASEVDYDRNSNPASDQEQNSAAGVHGEENLAVASGPDRTLAAVSDQEQNQGSGVDRERNEAVYGDRERSQHLGESSAESDSDRRPVAASLFSPSPGSWDPLSAIGTPLARPSRHSHAPTHTRNHKLRLYTETGVSAVQAPPSSNGMCQDQPIITEHISGSARALREYPEVWRLAGGTAASLAATALASPRFAGNLYHGIACQPDDRGSKLVGPQLPLVRRRGGPRVPGAARTPGVLGGSVGRVVYMQSVRDPVRSLPSVSAVDGADHAAVSSGMMDLPQLKITPPGPPAWGGCSASAANVRPAWASKRSHMGGEGEGQIPEGLTE
jgi:hypothetical protein